ncbi:RHS repeat-associated core domain-containing protein [Candidatus Kaiserbacteria bacterium]|nr:RHS repeat-associated core domain-containing protein [Candidatus Kaiserbacteria bacterium]
MPTPTPVVYTTTTITVRKYYFFGSQRVAIRETNESHNYLHYLHWDHLGSTVLTTWNSSGTRQSERGYYAFGDDRRTVNTPLTDHLFTGQKQDESGLYYYNARYYDPEIGQFISPDTLVPDPLRVDAYNRYMYSLGNPLKYTDPTGHYSDEALMIHFGCNDWACVEAQFDEDGQHAGRWGWLATLMAAEDNDTVTAWSVTEDLYQNIQGTFKTVNGKIMVAPTQLDISSPTGNWSAHFTRFAADATEVEFAARGVGIVERYSSARGPETAYDQRQLDCRHTDCVARSLDTLSTTTAGIALGCSLSGLAPCTGVAGTASTAFSAAGYTWTWYRGISGDASALDIAVSTGTTFVGAKTGPGKALVASGIQWVWDAVNEWREGRQ